MKVILLDRIRRSLNSSYVFVLNVAEQCLVHVFSVPVGDLFVLSFQRYHRHANVLQVIFALQTKQTEEVK